MIKIKTTLQKNKTSKYKGVSFVKDRNKYRVSYKNVKYGYFEDEEEAKEFAKVVRLLWQ